MSVLKSKVWLISPRISSGLSILILLNLLMQILPPNNLEIISIERTLATQSITNSATQTNSISSSPNQVASIANQYSLQPLSFEVNKGQVDDQVKFLTRGPGYSFFLTSNQAVFALSQTKSPQNNISNSPKFEFSKNKEIETKSQEITPPTVVKINFVGANPNPDVIGEEEQSGKSNYFIGNDPEEWQTIVSHYSRVRYKDVYPGIDVVYYGNNQGQLEYDFIINPGADTSVINQDFEGIDRLEKNEQGDLILQFATGFVVQHAPLLYQESNGVKKKIGGRYRLSTIFSNQVSFEVENYDKSLTLTIDPILIYSTYLDNPGNDWGTGVSVDNSGNTYVTGNTSGNNFWDQNVFISKFNSNGTLVYSTYLGGSNIEGGNGITIDNIGNVYATGYTYSNNFPLVNASQPNYGGGGSDAFVINLNSNGTLVYSTYLGGSGYDFGKSIVVDSTGRVYVTGSTDSSNFPVLNAFQPNYGVATDAFISEFNSNGTLVYSTYLGGSDYDEGYAIAIDKNSYVFVSGNTLSTNFPVLNAFQPFNNGFNDGFISKFNLNGTLVYSTYLGGSDNDIIFGIAIDNIGNSYFTGSTDSSNFPVLNAFQPNYGGWQDGFLVKISPFNSPPPPATGPTSAQSAGGGSSSQPNYPYTQICTCRPINTASGNFFHTFDDFAIPGRGFPLAFSHTYNSQFNTVDGPLGYGWIFNYNMSLSQDQNSGKVTVSEEGGSQLIFSYSNGVYQPPAFTQATLVKNQDGTFTFTRLNRQIFTFSAAGKLTQQKDLNGYTTNLSYNGNGQLATVTDPAGRTLTLTYSGTHLASVTDPANRHILFSYDGSGNLANFTDVGGGVTNFTYDVSHRLLTMQDPRGGFITNHYDGQGRVDWQSDQLARKTTLAYSADGTTITDPKGNVIFEQYIDNVRVAELKGYGTPQEATTTFTYDPVTMGIATITDPNGNVTSYTYDSQGNMLTVKDALNRQTTNTYDSLNDLLTTTDPKGTTTTFTYDNKGNLLSQSRPLNSNTNQVTTYHYGDGSHPGDVTSVTDPNGKNWVYTYDTYGNKASAVDPLANDTTFVYNNLGFKISQVSPKGNVNGGNPAQFTTVFSYNNFGLPFATTDPLGHTVTRHYDANQNLDRLTDAKGNITDYTYDAANQLIVVTRPNGSTLKTDYNLDGRIWKQYDGKNHVTVYDYDPLGRVISQTDPLGRTTGYTYDLNGNRLSLTDPLGRVTSYTYNIANEVEAINYSDGITPNVTDITYDENGLRIGIVDGTGNPFWTYDQLNRLKSSTNGAGQTVSYSYDLKGQLTGLTYPGNKTVTRNFDDAGNLISIKDWLGNTTNFSYDANSNLITQTLPAASGVTDNYAFDQADRLISINYAKNGPSFASLSYTRNENNLITGDEITGLVQPAKSFTYNSLNQLTGAAGENFTFDQADNLTGRNGATFNYDAANQLTALSRNGIITNFAFDGDGNRISINQAGGLPLNYSYDQANRLTGFGSIATYKYSGDGLRMSKKVNDTTTSFVWDEAGSLPMLLQEGQTSYIYGPGGLPLEQITANSTVFFYQHDQLGSTRLITDITGNVVATYTYDEWGNSRVKTGKISFQPNGHYTVQAGEVTNPFGFAGQYTDAETGFIYLRARYYDPSTSQFITRDPLNGLTSQGYIYSSQNPINRVDPSGLWDLQSAWKKTADFGVKAGQISLDVLGIAGGVAAMVFGGGLALGTSPTFVGTAFGLGVMTLGAYWASTSTYNLFSHLTGSKEEIDTNLTRATLRQLGAPEQVQKIGGVCEDVAGMAIPGPKWLELPGKVPTLLDIHDLMATPVQ